MERPCLVTQRGNDALRERQWKRQVFCSVFCVENDLPEVPSAERLSLPASPPRAPPVTNPPSTPSSFPSPALSLPSDPLSPDGGSIELEFYLAPEPFSVPSLLGSPPYSGLGGVGDPYAPLMVLMCRVCLEDKPIKPLPCCKKAVCEECLRVYLSSQVAAKCLLKEEGSKSTSEAWYARN
ncbi:hypothetical protein CB1_001251015 [Camelus ferus]|nr:hypothetical protein CB1_001251015 [Camelus ferus]